MTGTKLVLRDGDEFALDSCYQCIFGKSMKRQAQEVYLDVHILQDPSMSSHPNPFHFLHEAFSDCLLSSELQWLASEFWGHRLYFIALGCSLFYPSKLWAAQVSEICYFIIPHCINVVLSPQGVVNKYLFTDWLKPCPMMRGSCDGKQGDRTRNRCSQLLCKLSVNVMMLALCH